MQLYLAIAALASVTKAYDLQTLQLEDPSTGEAWRENVTFDFLNGDDQWLPDHDHIVMVKKCD